MIRVGSRHLRGIAAFLGLVFLATCCTDVSAPRPSSPVSRVSEACTAGGILEWDGSPGAPTRASAIRQVTGFWERTLGALLIDAGRSEHHGASEDPVKVTIAVRGLRALEAEVGEAEQALGRKDALEVSVKDDGGYVIASGFISAQYAGGYRLDQYYVMGKTTDHPRCR